VPQTVTFSNDRRFDWPGAIILIPALATLLLAITEACDWGVSTPLIACAAAALVLLTLFVWRESRAPAPLIDPRLFLSAAFSAGSVGVLISCALLYGIFFAMSFAFVRGYHDQPIVAGLRLAIVPVAIGVVSPMAGALSATRPRLIMLAGTALCAASALGLVWALDGTPGRLTSVMALLAAYGAGLGCFIAPNNDATIGAAPAERSSVAGGIVNLLRVLGASLGVAAAAAVVACVLESSTGALPRTSAVSEMAVLGATGDVLILLALFSAIGAAMAMVPKPSHGRSIGRTTSPR
jgi:hypothetical protein